MDDPRDDTEASARALLSLRRIAEALGQPPAAFFNAAEGTDALSDLAATTELLRLWSTLTSDVDRAAVLGFVRDLAEQRRG
ncbi:hypothetical protein Q8W71_14280 [Methylobacterium sp. NEAU 140]|uniref:hypothetical protein n=1 Tax=Methylobacterium sp. NEAU 140 TaxID=3064945 RepID=UPI002735D69B|nr:hypothetical protein [Methylobacterium sp. NEAU 140]MDP4023798.1 hypothetical protein [Methylobacterium sp. NEAU 140]